MNYLSKSLALLSAVVLFASCGETNDPTNPNIPIAPPISEADGYARGVLVLSEGNFSAAGGKLGFISPTGDYSDSIYYRANSITGATPVERLLGNVMQDLFVADGLVYMIAQNGDRKGSAVLPNTGKLFVCHLQTMIAQRIYSSEDLSELNMPTNIAAVGKLVYIRDAKGIYVLDRSTDQLTFITGTEGAQGTRLAVIGSTVFAITNSEVLAITNAAVTGRVAMANKPNGIVRSYDQHLWVSTEAKEIVKLTPALAVESTHELTGSEGASRGGHSSGFAAVRDTLYFSNQNNSSNQNMKLYRHIYSQNKTEQVADISTLSAKGTKYYNSIAADPSTGLVYFATAEWGASYLTDNSILVLDPKANYTAVRRYDSRTAFPAGIYPTESFK